MFLLIVCVFASSSIHAVLGKEVNYRLPKSLIPIQYNLTFVPYLYGEFPFEGHVSILFKVDEATSNVTLHKDGLNVKRPTIVVREDTGDVVLRVKKTTVDDVTNFYVIHLDGTMETGTQYTIGMNFSGNARDDMTGIYRSVYYSQNRELRVMITTQFEATNARRAFPCFDESWMKARFALTISRPGNMTSISNMPQEGQPEKHMDTSDGVGRYWDRYMVSPPMSTYLVAFIISDFENLSAPDQRLRVFARPSIIAQAQYSLDVSQQLLAWLAQYTALEFVLPKLDLVGIPDFDAGAMENWGMTNFRERVLLLEEGVTTTEAKQLITTTIAHELSHQWFGDLVTPAWWGNTWMSEGFAEIFGHYSTGSVFPSWRVNEQFIVHVQHLVMIADSYDTTRPVSIDISGSPSDIAAVFDDISYYKGAAIINMMKHMFPPDVFQSGIQRYLDTKSYDVATPDFLFDIFSDEFKLLQSMDGRSLDFKSVMKTWIEQAGYPVVQINRNYASATASISQKQFILKESFRRSGKMPAWFVPLSHTTQQELEFTQHETNYLWMRPQEQLVVNTSASRDEWMLFNIHQTGYYRVNYDSRNWYLLGAYLNSANFTQITPVNRAQLIDDSFNLARGGQINYCIPLTLSRYLTRETDLIPIKAFFANFEFINSRLSYSPDNYIQKYIARLMAPMYERIGFEERGEDDHVTNLTRTTIVEFACKLGNRHCLQRAVKLFNQSVESSVNIVADFRKVVYCSAIQQGGIKEWNYLWMMYQETASPALQALIIEVLGCSTNVTTLKQYLQMSLDHRSPIRTQDAFAVFHHLLHRQADVVLDFFINNYQRMEKAYGEMNNFAVILAKVSSVINTKRQIMKLKEFFRKKDLRGGADKEALKRAIATVDETLSWQFTRGKTVLIWAENEMRDHDNSLTCSVIRPRALIRSANQPSRGTTVTATTAATSRADSLATEMCTVAVFVLKISVLYITLCSL